MRKHIGFIVTSRGVAKRFRLRGTPAPDAARELVELRRYEAIQDKALALVDQQVPDEGELACNPPRLGQCDPQCSSTRNRD